MCAGDVSLITFAEHDPPRMKLQTKSNAMKSCVVWEKLEEWSDRRFHPRNEDLVRLAPSGR
ncbi:hypothetical protein K491DRAFT_692737 [Lophiostoma macrostomum CBS 122681]|uniref:Uncharacterized protein n=1 Tax=Lophiostoma macrostomum CBS 122681 TaxID=1314788 RepID=A0A6A6T7E1_9PLEO|nr:hypothetical protein K491DRAFT_692737 [Lophiostoma macrostomum CBS 122681]